MVDVEARKIEKWADTGDRTDPDDSSLTPALTRAAGWPASFSASDGDTPRRQVMNQLFRELTGLAVDVIQRGVLQWDAAVDYAANAVVASGSGLFRATAATGPASSNATDPAAAGQTVWASVAGQLAAPSAPSAPTGSAPSSSALFWSWRCPSDGGSQITGFTFQWRRAGTSSWTTVTTQDPFTTVTGLTNGLSYEARVRATNAQGSSAWSGTGTAAAAANKPGGGATLALRADPGDARAALDWLAPDDGGAAITGYTVQWRSGAQSWSSGRQRSVTGTDATITGLANGTSYEFRVAARSSAGTGDWSNTATAQPAAPVVPPAPDPDTAPARATAPEGVSRADDVIEWSWDLVTDDGGQPVTGYDFQHRLSTDSGWTAANIVRVARTCRAITVTDTTATVIARVRAVNSVGAGSWSPEGTLAQQEIMRAPPPTPDPVPPGAPTGLRASSGAILRADFSWTAPSDDGGSAVTGYDLQWRYSGGSWSGSNILSRSASQRSAQVSVSDATRAVEARARARNTAGASAWSDAATLAAASIRVARPSAPAAPSASSPSGLRVAFTWSAPSTTAGAPITGYDFQWRYSGAAWDDDNITAETGTSKTVTVADTSNAVEARVRAENRAGDSSWSAAATFAAAGIVPATPAAPTVTQVVGGLRVARPAGHTGTWHARLTTGATRQSTAATVTFYNADTDWDWHSVGVTVRVTSSGGQHSAWSGSTSTRMPGVKIGTPRYYVGLPPGRSFGSHVRILIHAASTASPNIAPARLRITAWRIGSRSSNQAGSWVAVPTDRTYVEAPSIAGSPTSGSYVYSVTVEYEATFRGATKTFTRTYTN